MNLLKSVPGIDVSNTAMIDRVRQSLEDRLDWLQDKEPEYDGEIHDNWEEKYDDLEEIIEMFDDLEENEDCVEIWDNIRKEIYLYQNTYHGISRLHI